MNRDPEADARQRRALKLRKAHYAELAVYAMYQGCTRVEARQVANDSLAQLMIYESNPDAKPIENPRAWLYEVTRRKALELFRDRRRHVPLSELPDEHFVDPRLGPEEHAVFMDLLGAIQELPHKYRLPLALSAKGDSIAEMAQFMGCTTDAAKQRLCRARKALCSKLGMDPSTSTSTSSRGRAE